MLRIGVVGSRFGAQVHVPAFRTDRRVEVCALAGRNLDRAVEAAAATDVPTAFGDWREMLDAGGLDAISIAVPPAEQHSIAVAAATRGLHLFCEKPAAASGAEADDMLDVATSAGVVHAVDFLFPEIGAWCEAKRLIADRAIGELRHFAYTWRVETYASRMNSDSWKNRPEAGGGAVGNFLSHVLYNVEWLIAPLAHLHSVPPLTITRAATSFDGVATCAGGIHGSISIATDAFLGCGHQVEIFGTTGTLVLRNLGPDHASGFELLAGTRPAGPLQQVFRERPGSGDGRVAAVARIVHRFIDAIEERGRVTPNLEDGSRIQRWLERAAALRGV